ncbi:hypothetical protein ACMAZF_05980 [Psychrobium sp. nBUS_13]
MKDTTNYQDKNDVIRMPISDISAYNASSINKEIGDTKFGIFRM